MNTTTQSIIPIAAIQMVSDEHSAANLARAEALIAQAALQGAKLVALPENFILMGATPAERLALAALAASAELQNRLALCAQKHHIWLIAGTIPLLEPNEDRARASCLAFHPDGSCVARYDKMHLFSFANSEERYNEADMIAPGPATPIAFSSACGRTAIAICYDLRFPEMIRSLGEIDLLIVPAAFTAITGAAHWEILLRARAIENQCYVLAPAQGGIHPNGRKTYGHSMIIDPWGEILASQNQSGEAVVLAPWNRERLIEVRTKLPALRHRRT